jgi:phosphopantetheinyl transferase (holo-ACP synthase)
MNIETLDIPFFYDGKKEKCALAVAVGSDFCPEDFRDSLSHDEFKKLSTAGIEKRKKQFCLGRITTKTALSCFQRIVFGDINVKNEESGCPVIENFPYATSITHTDEVVASLVFKNEFSFGLDVEELREKALDALGYVVFDREQIPQNLECLTAAWTLKESLSKALKCGFGLPLEEFELFQFLQNGDAFSCSYAKHPEFKGAAFMRNETSYAVAYPSNIDFEKAISILGEFLE